MSKSKPTKTEKLLGISTDPRDPFLLERTLISSDKWLGRYTEMPQTIREVVDNFRNPDFNPHSYGCSIGVGHNTDVGWYVLGSGQGPCVIWMEEDGYVDLLASNYVDLLASNYVDEDDLDEDL